MSIWELVRLKGGLNNEMPFEVSLAVDLTLQFPLLFPTYGNVRNHLIDNAEFF